MFSLQPSCIWSLVELVQYEYFYNWLFFRFFFYYFILSFSTILQCLHFCVLCCHECKQMKARLVALHLYYTTVLSCSNPKCDENFTFALNGFPVCCSSASVPAGGATEKNRSVPKSWPKVFLTSQ